MQTNFDGSGLHEGYNFDGRHPSLGNDVQGKRSVMEAFEQQRWAMTMTHRQTDRQADRSIYWVRLTLWLNQKNQSFYIPDLLPLIWLYYLKLGTIVKKKETEKKEKESIFVINLWSFTFLFIHNLSRYGVKDCIPL